MNDPIRPAARRLAGALARATLALVLLAGAARPATTAPGQVADGAAEDAAAAVLETLADQADRLVEHVESDLAWSFLAGALDLPAPPARVLFRDPRDGRWYAEAQAGALPSEAHQDLERVELPPSRFYDTKYGSPLAYARALDLLGATGLESLDGRRVLDIGYGGIGSPRLLALLGAEAVGLDVDSFLAALYADPADQGPVPTVDGPVGRVRLVHGAWPGDPAVADAVGTGFSVILSKNTLKRGYIHPTREAPAEQLIDLGVDDARYLAALHDALVPGGLVLLYNLCPPEAAEDEPFIPWADGRSPFRREQWVAAGFELLAFDVEDDAAARQLFVDLGYGEAEELETSLEAWYTLARRPAEQGGDDEGDESRGSAVDEG